MEVDDCTEGSETWFLLDEWEEGSDVVVRWDVDARLVLDVRDEFSSIGYLLEIWSDDSEVGFVFEDCDSKE